METLKNMLDKLTKLSWECRYLEAKPGLDEGLKKVLWRHNGEMELLHMFAHQLVREVAPDMMITYEDRQDIFQGIEFTYHRYYLYYRRVTDRAQTLSGNAAARSQARCKLNVFHMEQERGKS